MTYSGVPYFARSDLLPVTMIFACGNWSGGLPRLRMQTCVTWKGEYSGTRKIKGAAGEYHACAWVYAWKILRRQSAVREPKLAWLMANIRRPLGRSKWSCVTGRKSMRLASDVVVHRHLQWGPRQEPRSMQVASYHRTCRRCAVG